MPRQTRNTKNRASSEASKSVSQKNLKSSNHGNEIEARPKRTIKPTLRLIESEENTPSPKQRSRSRLKPDEIKVVEPKINPSSEKVPIYRRALPHVDESEANDVYVLKKSECETKKAVRKRPAKKGPVKKQKEVKKGIKKDPVTLSEKALPIVAVEQCPEPENLVEIFDEPNFDDVFEDIPETIIPTETEILALEKSPNLQFTSHAKEYKTPNIPTRITSKVREECKVSTPRLQDVVEGVNKVQKEDNACAGSYQGPSLAAMKERCFGFDDCDSESSADLSQGSIGGGSVSLSEISPVKRSSLLPSNHCLTMVGYSPSVVGISNSTNHLEKSQIRIKPSRFILPSKKQKTNLSALTSTKYHATTIILEPSTTTAIVSEAPATACVSHSPKAAKVSQAPTTSKLSNKENFVKPIKEKVTNIKSATKNSVLTNIDPTVEIRKPEPKKFLRPRTRQTLIYENVGQTKVLKTRKRKVSKTSSASFLDEDLDEDLPKEQTVDNSPSEEKEVLVEDPVVARVQPAAKLSKTYGKHKNGEAFKMSKKEAAVLSDWESQQSLHFSQIEDFDLMFNKD